MKRSDLTACTRPIDPHYATNRAIVLLLMGVTLAGMALQSVRGQGWSVSIPWGLGSGLAVFLAWALARELDPDHDLAAFVAAGLVLPSIVGWGLPELLPLFWALVLVRIVNRSPGLEARILDSLLLLSLGSWLTWQAGWIYGALTGAGFFLDTLLPQPHRRHAAFGGLMLLITMALVVTKQGWARDSTLPLALGVGLLLSSALFLLVIARSRQVTAVGDETGLPLSARRVQAGQALGLLAAIAVTVWAGLPGVVAIAPLWAALLGTGLYQVILHSRQVLLPQRRPQ
jgi:hypothetical protein